MPESLPLELRKSKVVKALRNYICCQCHGIIKKGESHHFFSNRRAHASCVGYEPQHTYENFVDEEY